MGERPPPSYDFSRKPPIETDTPPIGCTRPLENKSPVSEKQPHPLLKREAPFHEMIPRKSAINYSIKSS